MRNKRNLHTIITEAIQSIIAESDKAQQLKMIQSSNPMLDDVHVGIRTEEDIKTYQEAVDDEEPSYPDWTMEDALNAIENGCIVIYSSYPIENGVFVSPSKAMAWDYAGGQIAMPKTGGIKYLGNVTVYSKKVPLDAVAWISGDEGQYVGDI